MKRFSQLTQTATEADLIAGNFLAIDVPGVGGATKKLPAEILAKRCDVSLFFDKTVSIIENFVDVSCTAGDFICASIKGLTARIVVSNQNSTIFLNRTSDGVYFFDVTETTTRLKVWVDTAGVEIKLGLIRSDSINSVLKLIDEKNINDVSAYSDQDNVLDFANGVGGGHYQWDLSWVSSSSYRCSTHFPVAKGETFVVRRFSNQYAELVGFDSDDNCVYFDSDILSGSANQEYRIKNTTDNIVSYSIQINTAVSVFSWVKVFRVQEWMQSVFNTMLENAPISDEWTYIENDSLVIGSYSTSLVYSSSTTDMYGVYNVEGLARVKIKAPTNQWIANVFFEDENGTKFGRTASGNRIIPVPPNAKKMYVYTPASYIEAMNVWVNKTPHKTFFFGKRIAFFGTSIPAGFGAGLTSQNVCSYPKVMGKYLNCTVENLAVGSSCVCCKREDLISDSNPYGFTNDFEKCSRCLTNSIDEMNWIISNYNNGTFVYNVPASISADEANQIRSYSYENRVKQLFDGTLEPVDVILIEHGHNDNDTPDFTTDTDCSGGLYTYAGAMKFLLDYIYSFNPRQKVALVSHYENWQHVGTHDILTAQKNVANYFAIPLVDIANACGWGNYSITTKGNWVLYGDLSFWEATEDEHTFTDAVKLWIPDGTHPHTDRTGNANRHIARILAGKLQNIGW